ncbi:MAG: hypothetical protein P9X22_08550 [Candidatus Zapsychrus exili]|nr:hypothetical protein [Candidatus Zapsychrus exili]
MTDDKDLYYKTQEQKQTEWEALCTRCGACCGKIEGDPCEHMAVDDKGKTYCRIYEYRFGFHKTISGKMLKCVNIRDLMQTQDWPGGHLCAYKK